MGETGLKREVGISFGGYLGKERSEIMGSGLGDLGTSNNGIAGDNVQASSFRIERGFKRVC